MHGFLSQNFKAYFHKPNLPLQYILLFWEEVRQKVCMYLKIFLLVVTEHSLVFSKSCSCYVLPLDLVSSLTVKGNLDSSSRAFT